MGEWGICYARTRLWSGFPQPSGGWPILRLGWQWGEKQPVFQSEGLTRMLHVISPPMDNVLIASVLQSIVIKKRIKYTFSLMELLATLVNKMLELHHVFIPPRAISLDGDLQVCIIYFKSKSNLICLDPKLINSDVRWWLLPIYWYCPNPINRYRYMRSWN